jgi:hypothetical protein
VEYGFRTGQGRLHEIVGTATFAKQHTVLEEKKWAVSGEYGNGSGNYIGRQW